MEHLRSVCVYCGASNGVAQPYLAAGEAMGRLLADHGKRLIYGGGDRGLMGRVANSALEAGGEVVGIMPERLAAREKLHADLTELHVVPDMHTRKGMMMDRADAFVVLPGGLGTLEEFFEIVTWKQLGIHDKPIVVVNIQGYWDHLMAMIGFLTAEGFARAEDSQLFERVESVAAVLDALGRAPEPVLPVDTEIV